MVYGYRSRYSALRVWEETPPTWWQWTSFLLDTAALVALVVAFGRLLLVT